MRNLFETGACLEVASPVGIPDDFVLQIKPEERKRVHVAWRSANRIGVFLLSAEGMANVAPIVSAWSASEDKIGMEYH